MLRLGKLQLDFARAGYAEYERRLKHYTKFKDEQLTVAVRSNDPNAIKKAEAEAMLKRIQPTDHLVLLDERGKSLSSPQFATFLEKQQQRPGALVFAIGGAYGFDPTIYARANEQLSLSAFTFSHQLVPMIFAEQLYRAFTIIKGEGYHHG